MKRGPTLADYLANPDAFPEISRPTRTYGRRVAAADGPGYGARVNRGGPSAPATRYEPARAPLPEGRPEWARALPRAQTPPVERMRKPGNVIGPGGVLSAPPAPPMGPMTPPPTRYRSMGEAQLADAMMMQPMNPLSEALAAMPEPAGFASGTQSNGMRVPPAPASFASTQQPGMGLFGKRPGALTDQDWERALQSANAAAGKRPVSPTDALFALVYGPPRNGSARR